MNKKPCEYTSVIVFLKENLQIKYSQEGDMTARIGLVVEHRALRKTIEIKTTIGDEVDFKTRSCFEISKGEMGLIAYEKMANQIFSEVIKEVRKEAIAEVAYLFNEERGKLLDKIKEQFGKSDVETTRILNSLACN